MLKYSKEDLSLGKNVDVDLIKFKGIGVNRARYLCNLVGLNYRDITHNDLNSDCLEYLCMHLNKDFVLGEDLDKVIFNNVKKKKDVGCYAGKMHGIGMPVRGQSTKNNRKTARKLNTTFIDMKLLLSRLSGKDRRRLQRIDKRVKKQENKVYGKKK